MIKAYTLKVSTTGSAGSAAGSAALAVPLSELVAIYADYHASAPSTTDLTITSPGNPAAQTVLTLTNNKTDGWYYPRQQKCDNAGNLITGDYDKFVLNGNLLASLAQCDALTDAVTLTIYVRE